jgi:hypothetical protein
MSEDTNLVASHPDNRNAERHGVWARRNVALDPEVQAMAGAIMGMPQVKDMDEAGAVEIAKLIVLIDRLDADLVSRGITKGRTGEVRSVLDHRRRFSAQLERWLAAYGMTPAARAALLRDTATGGLAAEIARGRAAAREGQG